MNEQIEYFKRFSASYMRWTHFNFDRIVADVIRKDKEAEEKRKKKLEQDNFKNSTYGKFIELMNEQARDWSNKHYNELLKDNAFMKGVNWEGARIGTTLKIKLPVDYQLSKVSLTGTNR